MEPLAPGTEDDPPIMYASLKKQENEQERLLKLKAILPNGKYGNVFELNYVNGAEHWFCNTCKCPVMGRVYQHENGRRHSLKLATMNRFPDKANPFGEEEPVKIQVAPGEPVPPGFESEVEKLAQIQERLDGFNVGPLVALEYLVELQDYDPSKEPFYLCVLCDKRGDPRTVLTHLASYNHISQYLQKHFPSCYRALAPYITKQYKRNWQTTLQKLAEAIEKKYGRMRPKPVDKDKFEKERMYYLQLICKGEHFSEQLGHTFEELIVHEELTKVFEEESATTVAQPAPQSTSSLYSSSTIAPSSKSYRRSPSPPVVARPVKKSKPPPVHHSQPSRRRSLSSVSSISSSSDLSDGGDKKGRARSSRTAYRRRSPVPSARELHRREDEARRERLLPPWQKTNYVRDTKVGYTRPPTQKEKQNKLEEFKKLAKAIENDMDKTLKQHERNPEKHTQYNDEWKKFWNKRYKELQATGVDVSNYDFKPEWIKFWNKRMVELHQEEIKTKKDALRKRLGLPEEPAPVSFRIATGGKKISPTPAAKINTATTQSSDKRPAPMAAQPDNDPDIIVIDDKEDDKPKRSHSPWEREPTPPKKVAPPLHRKVSKERRSARRSYSRDRSRSIDRIRYRDRDRRNRSRERSRLTRSRSRDRFVSSKIDKKREYRESSFERDMRGKERVRLVSDLPWEREKSYRKEYDDYYKPPAIMRDVTRKPIHNNPVIPAEEDDNSEVNVVSVLRLLTALEERLGSLGPKVIDLLAQALAMEKNEPNSADKLLDKEINCVLFETIKEKLKGQLLAGFVDMIQERAFKIAIKKTASLIHLAGQRKDERMKNQPVGPVQVPGVGTVDKSAIARQIATALVAQGKTDVTQDELEQLINAVVGMAEASKKMEKPITTAGFLESFSGFSQMTSEGPSRSTSTTQEEPPIVVKPKEEPALLLTDNISEHSGSFSGSIVKDKANNSGSSGTNMDHLSDTDLQTLLQNFKDLSTEEQHGLINYLKKLETDEPERVERLRQFVNLGNTSTAEKDKVMEKMKSVREASPFSHRTDSGANPDGKITLDSDEEEDYCFEDVVKTVSNNVKAKELENERKLLEQVVKHGSSKPEVDLSDAKALISNLMSNISKNNNSTSSSVDLLGLGTTNSSTAGNSIVTSEFTKTLNSINMDSLANIVGHVQKMQQAQSNDNLQGIMGPDMRMVRNERGFSGGSNYKMYPNPVKTNQYNAGGYGQSSASMMGFSTSRSNLMQQPSQQQTQPLFPTNQRGNPFGNASRFPPQNNPQNSQFGRSSGNTYPSNTNNRW